MSSDVLVLNIDYTPLEVISWRAAIEKLFMGKIEVVERYADRFIRSPSVQFPFPAVVRLITGYARRKVKLSRKHILERDGFTCQYCGLRPRKASGTPHIEVLTIDHVVPRAHSQGGWVTLPWTGELVRVTSWENLLTACERCNGDKADRTPAQAGLTMRKRPRAPSPMDLARMNILRYEIPEEWKDYLPADSPWRDYWDGELS